MSMEAAWDLRAGSSPRSLCLYSCPIDASATAGSAQQQQQQQHWSSGGQSQSQQQQQQYRHSTNPFESAAISSQSAGGNASANNALAVVFGTEQGELHYRAFAPPATVVPSSSTPQKRKDGSIGSNMGIQVPLGLGSNAATSTGSRLSARNNNNLPRSCLPIDLDAGSLPGSVVACIKVGSGGGPPVFLLLVDDHRGTPSLTSSQPGAYQAHLAAVHPSGHFTLLLSSQTNNSKIKHNNSNQPTLPRMSCAAYHAETDQVVYAAGRTIANLPPETWQGLAQDLTAESGSTAKRGSSRGQRGTTKQHHRAGAESHTSGRCSLNFGKQPVPVLPRPGARSGQDGLAITADGKVAVVAVGNTFYAVAGQEDASIGDASADAAHRQHQRNPESMVKILSLAQSSQVHPVICLNVRDQSMEPDWSSLFLASGRECAIVDLHYQSANDMAHIPGGSISCSKQPRNGGSTTLASPILAAASAWPWMAVLTSDGLVSIRSPSCMAVPLRTVEVGNRPNDYFVLRTLHQYQHQHHQQQRRTNSSDENNNYDHDYYPWIVSASYSGQAKLLQCQPDSAQDLADRLMRHAIDAFGVTGFPRDELAEAVTASFTATSYVGPEPSPLSRALLKQYLEAVLGLADFEGGAISGWPTELSAGAVHHGTLAASSGGGDGAPSSEQRGRSRVIPPTVVSSASPASLLTGTALLCLVCTQLSPANTHAALASRASKSCAEKMGVVVSAKDAGVSDAAIKVCELVAEKLLHEASASISLLTGSTSSSSPAPGGRVQRSSQAAIHTDFCEAAIWLFRSCGMHERAIDVAHNRLQRQGGQQQQQQQSGNIGRQTSTDTGVEVTLNSAAGRGFWSQIKYESYTATHLSELWAAGKDEGCQLVLRSVVMHQLLENNPPLGLSVFTVLHPQNLSQWQNMAARDDPLFHAENVARVIELLKSVQPAIPYEKSLQAHGTARSSSYDSQDQRKKLLDLPLESGRALAVTFLESAIGIDTGRPTEPDEFDTLSHDENLEEQLANFHDELSFLLLEGVIAERRDDEDVKEDGEDSTVLGKIYRNKLRRFLRWPFAKIRSEPFMDSLPSSFFQEKALVLGKLGRHEDALRILYRDLQSLDLALEYCDDMHEQQISQQERLRARNQQHQSMHTTDQDHENDIGSSHDSFAQDNAYLPLVRVALMDSKDTERGTAAAIQVLALRRGSIDRAAALRLLPSDVPVSAVARPFLIPALVDSESQVRRLKIVSALLRARYLRLKENLTAAQLKAQANLYVVPQLRNLNLGDPSLSSKGFRARTTGTANASMPEVVIVKHFFPRHLIIQAKVTNINSQDNKLRRTLSDIAFVVAESSEEAIQPLLQVPIQALPYKMTGSAWCVLQAFPARMDSSTAQLTCELRYTVQTVDHVAATNNNSISSNTSISPLGMSGRAFVEELQDIEIFASHFG